MFKKILGTVGAKFSAALFGFIIVIINSRVLGAEGVGTISLIILSITIILLINSFVGGPALVYLTPRFPLFKLLLPSYLWAVFVAFSATAFMYRFSLLPREYSWHIMFLAIIHSLATVNQNVLLGKEKIKQHNLLTVLQISFLFLIVLLFYFVANRKEIFSYILALYTGYSINFLLGLFFISDDIKISKLKQLTIVIREALRYGFYVQLANIVQLFNYRLGYYLIEFYFSRAVLGIYSVGVQLSEALWLIGRSIAMVQYSRISNTKDKKYAKNITIKFIKLSTVLTTFLIAILLLLPDKIFAFVFSKDFSGLSSVIMSLAPGIIVMSGSLMLSHYFSGIGQHWRNTIGSSIGLAVTVILGFILIPRYDVVGAGLTASASYLSSACYLWIVFSKHTHTRLRDLLMNKSDIKFAVNEVRAIIRQS